MMQKQTVTFMARILYFRVREMCIYSFERWACVCVCTCVCTHTPACMCKEADNLRCHPEEYCPAPLWQSLSLSWSMPSSLDRQAIESQESTHPCFPAHSHTQFWTASSTNNTRCGPLAPPCTFIHAHIPVCTPPHMHKNPKTAILNKIKINEIKYLPISMGTLL